MVRTYQNVPAHAALSSWISVDGSDRGKDLHHLCSKV